MSRTLEEVWKTPIELEKCLSRKCEIRSFYFREAVAKINLERRISKLTRENKRYREAIDFLLAEVKELIKPQHSALTFYKRSLSDMTQVVGIYYFVTNEVINIWTILEKENYEVEMKIAKAQSELLSIFQGLRFDFMVIPKNGQKLEDIIPSNMEKLSP